MINSGTEIAPMLIKVQLKNRFEELILYCTWRLFLCYHNDNINLRGFSFCFMAILAKRGYKSKPKERRAAIRMLTPFMSHACTLEMLNHSSDKKH
jgi:hypothetical protein